MTDNSFNSSDSLSEDSVKNCKETEIQSKEKVNDEKAKDEPKLKFKKLIDSISYVLATILNENKKL